MDRKGKALKFVLLFVVYIVLEYLFLYFFPEGFERWQRENIAALLGKVLSLMGISSVIMGDLVRFSSGSIRIVYECTGGFAFFVFSSAVLAYPSDIKSKIIGHALGLIIIFILNLIRLVFISLVLIRFPSLFDFFHKYLWQASFIVVVIFLFIIWVEKWAKE